jgi:DNA-binding MurR/RpiR family transcriptional regulator
MGGKSAMVRQDSDRPILAREQGSLADNIAVALPRLSKNHRRIARYVSIVISDSEPSPLVQLADYPFVVAMDGVVHS